MLTVHHVTKTYGIKTILNDVSFYLQPGDRLGLIGPNGSGKTTLLRILCGVEKPNGGVFHFDPPNLRLGYLPQGLNAAPGVTIGNFLDQMMGDPEKLSARLEQLSSELSRSPNRLALEKAYDSALAALQAASWSEHQLPEVLAALELEHFAPDTPVAHLSGGQKTRLSLAGVLLSSPQLLLLDEPTNHLDIEMLAWLENWLVNSPLICRSAALLVSHDRVFLDQTINGVLELDPISHQVKSYVGNYSAYLEQILTERERHWQQYTDQQEEISRLRQAARAVRAKASFKRGGKGDTGDKFAKGFFANRSKEHVKRAKNIERRLRKLLSEDKIDKPSQSWQMKLDLSQTLASSRQVLVMENLIVGYGDIPLLAGLNLSVRFGQRVVLIGPNGAGKTTLLRTLVGQIPPLEGRIRMGASVKPGFMAQEQDTLDPDKTAFETIRLLAPLSETEARAFLHQYLFSGDDVFITINLLSYGERARLMLACLAASGCNFLLLDEPINHLDIPSRTRFEQSLTAFPGTVLAVVHDRYFISGFATHIWEIHQGTIETHENSHE